MLEWAKLFHDNHLSTSKAPLLTKLEKKNAAEKLTHLKFEPNICQLGTIFRGLANQKPLSESHFRQTAKERDLCREVS